MCHPCPPWAGPYSCSLTLADNSNLPIASSGTADVAMLHLSLDAIVDSLQPLPPFALAPGHVLPLLGCSSLNGTLLISKQAGRIWHPTI